MILNTGARTDTVQYYTKWLLKRFEEGYALSRNPLFPNKVTRLELTPDVVDCVVFCSKNYGPILGDLHRITERFHTFFFYTITAYGKDIEPGVPPIDESIENLLELERQVGAQRICWRYDPVLLTNRYTIDVHLRTFEAMAARLSGHVARCIFSFVEVYKKLETNMPELKVMTTAEMNAIARGIGTIAQKHGLYLQTCGTNGDYRRYGIHPSGCMTLQMLGQANGIAFRGLQHKGSRAGCRCIDSRDIGAYDTCINGCKYCYANRDPQIAAANYRRHDPDSPLLLGHVRETDCIQQGAQRSFLVSMSSRHAETKESDAFPTGASGQMSLGWK